MKKVIISYLFFIIALAMFFYTTFFSNIMGMQTQGIYWFGVSLVCLFLPEVNKLKLKDVEVEFKDKLDKVEKQLVELEDDFFTYLTTLKKEEDDLPKEYIEKRNRHWDNFERYVLSLDDETRFQVQKANSLNYLAKFKLTVKELKERLARLGYYNGQIDDNFTKDLAEALTKFQRLNNMRHIDGIFGQLTYEKVAAKLSNAVTKANN
jgi:hypothetical protein